MSTATETSVARELEAICGAEHIAGGALAAAFAIEGVTPQFAAAPGSAEEVAAILRLATERDLVVVPAGGFTRQHIGGLAPRVDIVLRTARLTAIEHYDPGDLTVGLGAGARLADVHAMLAENRQLLPVDAAAADGSTIGGALATAAHGPLRHAYGGVRDFCIGVRFVTGDGRLARGGGRVVKNVAGYDLMKLLIGSYGTLGVMTAASFKLFPLPGQTRTFVAAFGEMAEALRFRDLVARSPLTPLCLEVASPRAAEFLRDTPFAPRDSIWLILLRAAGSDAVLARYRTELGGAVKAELEGASEAGLWQRVATFPAAVPRRHQNALMLSVSVPRAEVGAALEAAERAALDNSFFCATVGRAAGALTVAMMPLPVDPPAAMQYAGAASALRAALSRHASAVVLHCPREAKAHFSVWGSTPTDLDAMRAVKRALDPAGILNRGRFLIG